MIRPDFEKWDQDCETVRVLGIEADHRRSRERFQALYMIGSGKATPLNGRKKRVATHEP